MIDQNARVADYRRRAGEVRAIANGIEEAMCRNDLFRMAEDYDNRASLIEANARQELRRTGIAH